jgi:hypothetical protein
MTTTSWSAFVSPEREESRWGQSEITTLFVDASLCWTQGEIKSGPRLTDQDAGARAPV